MSSVFEIINEDSRLTTFPINRDALWQMYKFSQRSYWVPDEILMADDRNHYVNKLTPGQQRCVKNILAFFAASDGVVNINLAKRFKDEVQMLEAGYFYDYQMMMENIHAETYSILLTTIIVDPMERSTLLNAIKTMPIITSMTNYMFDCINSDKPFAHRLLRMACVEGIFFSGCFCLIYWLASKGLMPGLVQSNSLIARDEGLHTDFALMLYKMVKKEHQLVETEIHHIFSNAVDIAVKFICDTLPEPLPEMNAMKMTQYIKYIANNNLAVIDVKPLFPEISENPMRFMEMLNLPEKPNFFEHRSTNYSKPIAPATGTCETTEDF